MILELSDDFLVSLLCEKMGIQRSSFYNWKHTLTHPAERTKALLNSLALFEEYHLRYPSHEYRWLNAKIRLDTGTVMSDPYAHKCCKTLGVKSEANSTGCCRCTALPGQCQEPEPQRTMRPWNPSMDGSKRKSSWIFMSPVKVLLSRKRRHTSRFSILHGPHIR